EAQPPQVENKGWLGVGLVVGLLLVASAAAVTWIFVRRRPAEAIAAAPPVEPNEPDAVAATVLVPCSACGKTLKVKAELAKQRVRCAKCRQGVVAPRNHADGSDSASA